MTGLLNQDEGDVASLERPLVLRRCKGPNLQRTMPALGGNVGVGKVAIHKKRKRKGKTVGERR